MDPFQHLLEPGSLLGIPDPAGDPHAIQEGHIDQEAGRQGELGGDPGPLGAEGILVHLHHHLVALGQQVGDAGLLAVAG